MRLALLIVRTAAAGWIATAAGASPLALDDDLARSADSIDRLCDDESYDEAIEGARAFFGRHGSAELARLGPLDRRRLAELYLDYADALEETGQVAEAHAALTEGLGRVPLHPRMALQAARLAAVLGQGQTLGRLHPYFQRAPELREEHAALMARARREDVVAPLDAPLFGDRAIEIGQWEPELFLRRYGTALFLVEPWDEDRIPVVFVHGINDSPRSLAPLVAGLRSTGYQAIVFYYPTGLSLAQAGAELDRRMAELERRHSIPRFGLVGHSLGGLVAASMLARGAERHAAAAVPVFVAIASPWAGFDLASGASWVPYHPASWTDLVPDSPVLRRLHRREDRGTATYLFFAARGGEAAFASGNDDGVVPLASVMESPVTARARDVFGFYEDHMSILGASRVHERLGAILDAELARRPPSSHPKGRVAAFSRVAPR